MSEKETTDKAIAALMAISDEWWRTAGSQWQLGIANLCSRVPGPFKERFYDWFSKAMRQAHTEGLSEGYLAGKDVTNADLQSERDTLAARVKELERLADLVVGHYPQRKMMLPHVRALRAAMEGKAGEK